MRDIVKLFAKPTPALKEESHLGNFMRRNNLKRTMITVPRDGQAAGTRDVKVVGAQQKRRRMLNDLPGFTPKDAGFLHRAQNPKDQAQQMDKFMKRGTLKDAEFRALMPEKPTNPLYYPHKHLGLITTKEEREVISQCHPEGAKKMIAELNTFSSKLLTELPQPSPTPTRYQARSPKQATFMVTDETAELTESDDRSGMEAS